ncbi:MAG: FMN reductase [Phascolarctobacterium sp.]|nr:MAG: FMN reductase [Phascolarctobacterium sp.]
MNRREFLKVSCSGLITLFLSGCGVNMLGNGNPSGTGYAAASSEEKKESGKMKIVVITGSPHKAGTSALLADKFIEGAEEKGHEVFRFNAAFKNIHPCTGCNACEMDGPCIFKDDIEKELMPQLLAADLIVLVTPLYYYDMSAQIKTVIDRMHGRLRRFDGKKSILMATAWNSSGWTFDALVEHYESLVEFMHWQDMGKVLGYGCGTRRMIEGTEFPEQAKRLGMSL